jgi:nucleotide sugar dehydrogenase
MTPESLRVGFVGQGWIGKNYADDFEWRGFSIVRYGLEEPYAQNKAAILECDIVFVAVPTPTTPDGFDDSIVREAVALTKAGTIVVLKSTLMPGVTTSIQEQYPDRIVMHSPEFLREAHAAEDAAHPERNIVGIALDSEEHTAAAQKVLGILPEAPYERVMSSLEAELVKYAGNCVLYQKVVFANLLHDLTQKLGGDYEAVRDAFGADPRIGSSHLRVMHESRPGEMPARGAGGHCFIKDYAAFRELYEKTLPEDARGIAALNAIEMKNVEILRQSGKDSDLLDGVYGPAN